MRVITGTARGRKLEAPLGYDTRPTSEMTKEAVFSMIQFEVEGAVFGDFFAGSGQMGIEALSRGAATAVLVENERDAVEIIRNNIKKVGFEEKSQIMRQEVLSYVKTCNLMFDIVFLDPPYNSKLLDKLLPLIAQKMNGNGVILCETEKNEVTPEIVKGFKKQKEHKYGKAKITVYRGEEA